MWARLKALWNRRQLDQDIDDEVAFHLAMRELKNRADGSSLQEARYAARRQFGSATHFKEQARDMWRFVSIEAWWRDFTFALRTLRKRPGFTATAILTLGLGIGSSTAIFSVIDNILIQPFPYPDAGRFFGLEINDPNKGNSPGRVEYPGPEFLDYVEKNRAFDRTIANAGADVLYSLGDGTIRFHGVLCTPGTFEFFGMPALHGRVMTDADYEPGAPPVFVMRYKTWLADFGGDLNILNKAFLLNGESRTLVGIMPPRFAWGDGDVFLPVKPARSTDVVNGEFPPVWYLIGHLKPGLSVSEGEADLAIVANQLAQIYPRSYPSHFTVKLFSFTEMVVGRFRSTLYLTLAGVVLLLLIACANIANLLLAGATARERELVLRATLGASRSRLVRQLLVESLVLAICGGAFGVALAAAGLRYLITLIPPDTIAAETQVSLNAPVLLFAVAIAILTPLLFGLVPALRAARNNLEAPLRASRKGTSASSNNSQLRDLVIIGEVALSFTMLVSAGLLTRNLLVLCDIDLGIKPDHVLITRLPLPANRYQTAAQLVGFYRPLLERLRNLPGAIDVAETTALPPYGGFSTEIGVAGKSHPEKWTSIFQLCSEGYFNVLRIPLLDGRTFTAAEVNDARHLAVINKSFASRYFGAENPIGRRVHITGLQTFPDRVSDPWFEIIGVVHDAKNQGLQLPAQPEVWLPYTITGSGQRGVLVRTTGDPTMLMNDVRNSVWATDRNVALTYTGSLENFLNTQSYAGPKFGFVIMGIFAGTALVLVVIGVYSVVAYSVASRTHEIGIRLALGATRSVAVRLVLNTGMRVVLVGIATGLAASLIVSRIVASQLWRVSAFDPLTVGTVAAILTLTGAAACLIPASRATSIEPTSALRHD